MTVAKRRPGTPEQRARDAATYQRRKQRAQEAGYRGYSGAGGSRQAGERRGGPPARLPAGVDVSAAGTHYDGNRSATFAALVRRAAAVMGTGGACTLVVSVDDLDYDSWGKGPARGGGYGVVNEAEDEVTISIPDESGYRDDDTGQWIADGFTLGDILDAIDNEGGDVRAGVEDLVLGTVGIENVGAVTGYHLTIPGYRGG